MGSVDTKWLKRIAISAGYQLKRGAIRQTKDVYQMVWELQKERVVFLFDSAWDVLEGMDWLREEPEEANRLLRKRSRAAAVGHDSNTARVISG